MTTLQTSPLERPRTLHDAYPTITRIGDIPWNQYRCDLWASARDAAQVLDANQAWRRFLALQS